MGAMRHFLADKGCDWDAAGMLAEPPEGALGWQACWAITQDMGQGGGWPAPRGPSGPHLLGLPMVPLVQADG